MQCPYPDCTGEVTAGEQFCGECGRSLAPAAVAAAKAGMAASGRLAGPPLAGPIGIPPPGVAPVPPGPVVVPGPAAAARPARLPWILGGAVGAVLLSIVCCFGSLLWIGANVTPTPTAAVPHGQAFRFTLAELTAANGFKTAQDVRGADGNKLGVLSLNANYSYQKVGSPELIGTVEVRVNNNVVLELAASNQPEYAASNPKFEVAEDGKTYTAHSVEGWQVAATVSALVVDDQPTLGNGQTGKQPVFSTLDLDLEVTPAP